MRIDPARRLPADPGAASRSASPACLTPRAEPKWLSSARLRAAPMPGTSSSSLLRQRLGAAGAVGGDGEAVRLVPQALQEVQHRVARRQLEGRAAVHVEPFAAGVAVGALGDRRPAARRSRRDRPARPARRRAGRRRRRSAPGRASRAAGRPPGPVPSARGRSGAVSTSRIMAKSSPGAIGPRMLNFR